jgi:glycosyltransferase involved in cell wall biosynthesis
MNARALVSIVTPAYNQGEYLAATIESVLAQDYPAIEYIVIDDGSNDSTLAVANQYAMRYPGRLTVLTQPNRGQAASLNRAWAQASGSILGYLSSDDMLCPSAVSELVAALELHSEAKLVYCDMWLIDSQGHRLRTLLAEDFDRRRMCEQLICQPGVGALFRREIFDRSGGWNEQLQQVPDFEFWLRASCFGDFVRLPRLLGEYRVHDGSASFQSMSVARAEEIMLVARKHWISGPATGARIALARAMSIAAKNHAQSGRPLEALRCFSRAVAKRPRLALELGVWRSLLVGFSRRSYYGAMRRWAALRAGKGPEA